MVYLKTYTQFYRLDFMSKLFTLLTFIFLTSQIGFSQASAYSFNTSRLDLGQITRGEEIRGEFIYKNLRLVDVLDGKYFNWIDSIPWIFVTSVAEFLITVPLFLFLLCFAMIFFLIQAFKRVK